MAEAIRKAIQMKKSSLMRTGLTLTLTLALIFVGFYVVTSDTLGWFSANKKVDANGMAIMADDLDIGNQFFYRSASTDAYFSTATLYVKTADGYDNAPSDRALGKADYYEKDENDQYVLAFDGEGFRPVSEWAKVFNTLQPGDKVHVKAKYTNQETDTYYATASFIFGNDRKNEEEPMTQAVTIQTHNKDDLETYPTDPTKTVGTVTQENDPSPEDPNRILYTQKFTEFYYLGSQLYISAAWTGTHDRHTALDERRFFVPNPTEQVCFYEDEKIDVDQLENTVILAGFEIPPNQETTLYFEIEFLSLKENQNNYKFKNFGPSGGRCIRHFLTDFSTTPPEATPPAN